MPGENKQYPARPNAWYCIWTYLNLDILSTFLCWFRFKHRRVFFQFQVLVKMDRLINLWSIWALSAPSLDLRSFGPAILDYGWIMDGYMVYGPPKMIQCFLGSHILTAICVESRFEGVECHTGLTYLAVVPAVKSVQALQLRMQMNAWRCGSLLCLCRTDSRHIRQALFAHGFVQK